MQTLPKLLILGGIVTVAGIAAYGIRRRRRLRADVAPDEFGDEGVVVVVSEVDPDVISVVEERVSGTVRSP
jgi:hypothetical protein